MPATMAADQTASLRNELLKDPAVQDAIRKAGNEALADPAVQRQILDTCKEKFPELAASVRDQVTEWASDPEVQQQARNYAFAAADVAKQGLEQSGDLVVGLLAQGPAGVRVLAFGAGLCSCVNSVFLLTGALNPLSAISSLFFYVLLVYEMMFSFTTMLFEAKPEWIARVPGLDGYQNMLIAKAEFLCEVLGRGLFYGFQGTLWLSFSSLQSLFNVILAVWFMALAFLHISMHWGVMPQHLAAKTRQGLGVSGYMKIPLQDNDQASPRVATPVRSQGDDSQRQKISPAAGSDSRTLEASNFSPAQIVQDIARMAVGAAPTEPADGVHAPAADVLVEPVPASASAPNSAQGQATGGGPGSSPAEAEPAVKQNKASKQKCCVLQ